MQNKKKLKKAKLKEKEMSNLASAPVQMHFSSPEEFVEWFDSLSETQKQQLREDQEKIKKGRHLQ